MLTVKIDVSALQECTKVVCIEVPLTSRVEQLADAVKGLCIVNDVEAGDLHFWTRTGKRLHNKFQLRHTRVTEQPLLVAEVCSRPQSRSPCQSIDSHSVRSLRNDVAPLNVSEVCTPEQSNSPLKQVHSNTHTEDRHVENKSSEQVMPCNNGDEEDSDDDIQIVYVSGEDSVTDQQIESFMTAIFQRYHEKKIGKAPGFNLVIKRLHEAYPTNISSRKQVVERIYKKLLISCPRRNDGLVKVECTVGDYQLTTQDFATLQDGCWLNDNIINAYLYLLAAADPTVYPSSTFFYPTLLKRGYKSVESWTKKKNLFKYRLILVPVHLDNHWTLAIINIKDHMIQYYDSVDSENHLCLRNLKKFMMSEASRHKNPKWKLITWKTSTIEGDVPRQTIGGDCGVFACQFAKYMVAREYPNFHQNQMCQIRRQMNYDLRRGEVKL